MHALLQWLPQELQARRENLRKGQKTLAHQLDRLTEASLSEVIPLREYKQKRGELEQRKQALQAQEQQLKAQVNQQAEVAGMVVSIEEFCRRVRAGLAAASFEQKRQLIELLVDRVVVADGEVEIRYAIPTGPAGEHIRFCHLRSDYFCRPHLIRLLDLKPFEQVGENEASQAWPGSNWAWARCLRSPSHAYGALSCLRLTNCPSRRRQAVMRREP